MFNYLHIPHTGGRVLRATLHQHLISYNYIHNPTQMLENYDCKYPDYFVLREPVERCLAEYTHYSRNLKNISYVNYLSIHDFNTQDISIETYYSIEKTCNLTCKFLLHRTDFNIPVTETEFNQILQQNLIYDTFSKSIQYTNLFKLINDISLDINRNRSQHVYQLSPLQLSESQLSFLKTKNNYDLKLYFYLISKN